MTAPSSGRRNSRGRGFPSCGEGRQRADLDKAEAEVQHSPSNFGVLVESGREAERVREPESEGLDREAEIAGSGRAWGRDLEPGDRGAVRRLRRQKPDEGLSNLGKPHPSRLPKSWRPSGASGSGRDQTTALIGRRA